MIHSGLLLAHTANRSPLRKPARYRFLATRVETASNSAKVYREFSSGKVSAVRLPCSRAKSLIRLSIVESCIKPSPLQTFFSNGLEFGAGLPLGPRVTVRYTQRHFKECVAIRDSRFHVPVRIV